MMYARSGFLALVFSLVASVLLADVTYYVAAGGDGSDPTSGDLTKAYAHPQTAVDAADGTTPTVIKIAPGTYGLQDAALANTQVLNVDKGNLTVEALEGYGTVTLAGNTGAVSGSTHTRRVLTVASGLENLMFRDLIFLGGDGYRNGDRPTCASVASGRFENCDLIGYCIARCGMMSLGGTSSYANCRIRMTSTIDVDSNGTPVAISLGGSAVFEDCLFGPMKWYASSGNNMRAFQMGGTATLRRCTVQGIISGRPKDTTGQGYGTWSGGGLIATGGTITDCVFTNNFVYGNGGGLCVNGAGVTVSRCRFRDNGATGRYNDLYVATGTVTDSAGEDLDGTNGNLGAYPDKVEDGAWYAIVVSNTVKAVRAGVAVPVRLDATSDVAPTAYDWTFEDAELASGRMVSHTFATAGRHTITCVVTLADGSTVSVSKEVLVVGPVCYVSKSGSDTPPYDTPAKAARHPQDALDLRPSRVVIDTGTYGLRNPARDTSILAFPYGYDDVEVTAQNGRGSVWLDAGKTEVANGALSRVVTVGEGLANVVLSDLCLTNGWSRYNGYNGPGTLYAYAGTFRNCSINLSGFSRNGGGMITKEAVLTNCLITSISPYTYTGSTADIGLSVSGGAQLLNCEVCDYTWCTAWPHDIPCVKLSGADSLIRGCLFHNIVIGKTGSALRGAAVYATGGTLESCTITGCKSFGKGGGLYIDGAGVVCRNNIIFGNTAINGGNDIATATDYAGVTYTLASDLTPSKETGNLQTASILFKEGAYSLDKDSQCVNAGLNQDWMYSATDRAGNSRVFDDTVDLGAYECQERGESLIADFAVSSATSIGASPLEVQVTANVSGGDEGATYAWDWGDGTSLEMQATNGVVSHIYSDVGAYTVTMTVAKGGMSCVYALTNLVAVVGEVCYVSTNGAAIPPYDTWAKATSNIQDAVAYAIDTVMVSDGVYRVDHSVNDYGIFIQKPIRLISVGGREVTFVESAFAKPTASSSGGDEMKCLLTLADEGANVTGFTFRHSFPPLVRASAGAFVNNDVVEPYKTYAGDIASFEGSAGVTNCLFDGTDMIVRSVNAETSLLRLSGSASADRVTIRNYRLCDNRCNDQCHGAVTVAGDATLRNSLVAGAAITNDYYSPMRTHQNAAVFVKDRGVVENCTVVGSRFKAAQGAGVMIDSTAASVRNVISWDNVVEKDGGVVETMDLYCMSVPAAFANCLIGAGALPETATGCLPVGTNPLFAADGAGYRLSSGSPCVNAGMMLPWCSRRGLARDLDGGERRRNRPDIGCYELQRDNGLIVIVF